MKKLTLTLGLLISLQSNASDLREFCDYIEGAIIISSDTEKEYLGKISSSHDSDSIFGGVSKSMLTLNEAIIDVKKG